MDEVCVAALGFCLGGHPVLELNAATTRTVPFVAEAAAMVDSPFAVAARRPPPSLSSSLSSVIVLAQLGLSAHHRFQNFQLCWSK